MKKTILAAAFFLTAVSVPASAQTFTGLGASSGSAWLGGAVAGYNWQRGSLVFGFEGDISGINLKSETTGTITGLSGTFSYDAVARIDWYGTVRARLGWTAGSFLFYGTGGLAYGNVSLNNTEDLGAFGKALSVGPLIAQTSAVKVGWVAGAGIDYMMSKNLILNLQYQYIDLGTVNVAGVLEPTFGFYSPSSSQRAQFQVVTVGASWKFPPPPGSSNSNAMASMNRRVTPPPPQTDPWSGIYVGARTGGAWGNGLTAAPNDPSYPPTF
jgi:outer membrane immunogenic protein